MPLPLPDPVRGFRSIARRLPRRRRDGCAIAFAMGRPASLGRVERAGPPRRLADGVSDNPVSPATAASAAVQRRAARMPHAGLHRPRPPATSRTGIVRHDRAFLTHDPPRPRRPGAPRPRGPGRCRRSRRGAATPLRGTERVAGPAASASPRPLPCPCPTAHRAGSRILPDLREAPHRPLRRGGGTPGAGLRRESRVSGRRFSRWPALGRPAALAPPPALGRRARTRALVEPHSTIGISSPIVTSLRSTRQTKA